MLFLYLFIGAFASAAAASDTLPVHDAFARADRGELTLIDIRSSQEWLETGIPSPARALSMYDRDFLLQLNNIIVATDNRPVAFICATGSRSAWLRQALAARGMLNLLDVPEGMLGNSAGPGWLRAGLPVRPYDGPDPRHAPTYSLWERLRGSYRPPWFAH
ncbi:MAG: rhodanese-like domain-containing protein [Thiogranum sp.]|nr:rhodanese-like domain-containing protein [Thiogranum sp.]